MPWRSNDPDPLEERRRKLADQEKQIAAQLSRLNQQMNPGAAEEPAPKPPEPPVWRLEEDTRTSEPLPVRKRHLARQRQRDMILFFAAVAVLLVVMGIGIWVAYAHNASPNTGP